MVNLVVLAGNLCSPPDLKYTSTGTAVANLRLAVNSTYRTASGEKRENTLFIDVVAWGKSAEACAEYLDKGSKILAQGELRMREWDDRQTGRRISKIEVHAQSIRFLSSTKKDNGTRETTTAAVPAGGSSEASEPGEDVPF